MNGKAREGFWMTLGTLAAQGLVESGERYMRHSHGHGHFIALGLAGAAWGFYKLMGGKQ